MLCNCGGVTSNRSFGRACESCGRVLRIASPKPEDVLPWEWGSPEDFDFDPRVVGERIQKAAQQGAAPALVLANEPKKRNKKQSGARARKRVAGLKAIRHLGLDYKVSNGGSHLMIWDLKGQRWEYWPTTGKHHRTGSNVWSTGGLEALKREMGV